MMNRYQGEADRMAGMAMRGCGLIILLVCGIALFGSLIDRYF